MSEDPSRQSVIPDPPEGTRWIVSDVLPGGQVHSCQYVLSLVSNADNSQLYWSYFTGAKMIGGKLPFVFDGEPWPVDVERYRGLGATYLDLNARAWDILRAYHNETWPTFMRDLRDVNFEVEGNITIE